MLVGECLGGPPLGHDAVGKQDHLGGMFGVGQVVGGQHHRRTPRALGVDGIGDGSSAGCIEPGCGFVEQQHPGLPGQHLGKMRALLLAT